MTLENGFRQLTDVEMSPPIESRAVENLAGAAGTRDSDDRKEIRDQRRIVEEAERSREQPDALLERGDRLVYYAGGYLTQECAGKFRRMGMTLEEAIPAWLDVLEHAGFSTDDAVAHNFYYSSGDLNVEQIDRTGSVRVFRIHEMPDGREVSLIKRSLSQEQVSADDARCLEKIQGLDDHVRSLLKAVRKDLAESTQTGINPNALEGEMRFFQLQWEDLDERGRAVLQDLLNERLKEARLQTEEDGAHVRADKGELYLNIIYVRPNAARDNKVGPDGRRPVPERAGGLSRVVDWFSRLLTLAAAAYLAKQVSLFNENSTLIKSEVVLQPQSRHRDNDETRAGSYRLSLRFNGPLRQQAITTLIQELIAVAEHGAIADVAGVTIGGLNRHQIRKAIRITQQWERLHQTASERGGTFEGLVMSDRREAESVYDRLPSDKHKALAWKYVTEAILGDQLAVLTLVSKLTASICERLLDGGPLARGDCERLASILPQLTVEERSVFGEFPIGIRAREMIGGSRRT